MNAITEACTAVGGQRALALALRISAPTVHQWINGARRVPEDRCPEIELACKGAVTCEQLRPDLSWVRVADSAWPHAEGRPLLDHAARLDPAPAAAA